MSKSGRFFWHTSTLVWHSLGPSASVGNPNVLGDILVTLVNTESVGAAGDTPVNDQFVVERIVGQYQMVSNESVGVDRFCHHRVYVSDSDETAVGLRDLTTADDAETSFLWHQVDAHSQSLKQDVWGNWQSRSKGNDCTGTPWMGRFGHVDIKVGRRIEGGQSLIWHAQLEPAPPANNEHFLKLWLRMLLREAG